MIETVATDAFEMDYLRFGSGAKPLVILPGLSVQSVLSAAGAIERQYHLFCRDFTVYLFDRRKHPPESYSVCDMADDTAAAMRQLGLSDTCLFGASQGGMIAMTIAVNEPSLVGKLALGSTACRMDAARCAVIDGWIRLAREQQSDELYHSFGKAVYPAAVFEKYRAAFSMMASTVTPQDLERFIILAKGTADFDVRAHLPGVACPVLVLGDSDDRVLGADASNEISAQLQGRPDCEMYLYQGCGHAAYDTAPDYAQRLFAFFTKE
ncbi:MAG: alpha/beta hydrolase [Clostridia bacterium]|nr:alpha/beta hydrolase [Clostridia bacterium]